MKTLWALIVLLFSGVFFYVCYVTSALVPTHDSFACVILALCISAIIMLGRLRFTTQGRHFFHRLKQEYWTGAVATTALLVGLSTLGFSLLSSLLYSHGIGTLKGVPRHGFAERHDIYLIYLWQVADAVPLLKIPETLSWKLSYGFADDVQGTLLIIYTATVILPVVYTLGEFGKFIVRDREAPSDGEKT